MLSNTASLYSAEKWRPPPFYQEPALWTWPASQEQMVARPEGKFDLNVDIQNPKSTTIGLLKSYPPHFLSPAWTTVGGEALSPLTIFELRAKIPAYLGHVFLP